MFIIIIYSNKYVNIFITVCKEIIAVKYLIYITNSVRVNDYSVFKLTQQG